MQYTQKPLDDVDSVVSYTIFRFCQKWQADNIQDKVEPDLHFMIVPVMLDTIAKVEYEAGLRQYWPSNGGVWHDGLELSGVAI
jgi:hypothetical protein